MHLIDARDAPAHPRQALGQLVALDGIRGLAVLAVMACHFERFVPAVGPLGPLKAVVSYGWIGVDLFFALSGFLITGILLRTREATNYFRSFYGRRTLRIFPIYYATLIVVFAGVSLFPEGAERAPSAGDRWLYFAFLSNWIGVWRHEWPPNVLGHFWSLAVEEQFYLLWPLCVLIFARHRLWWIAIGLSALALVLRCAWLLVWGSDAGLGLATFCRMDSLLLGAVAAMLFLGIRHDRIRSRLTGWWIALPLAAFPVGVALAPQPMVFVQSIGYSFLAFGFAALVLAAAVGDGAASRSLLQRTFRTGWLCKVGKYSYGMYVYHVPVLGICELLILRKLPPGLTESPVFALVYVAFLAALTYAVALLSYELVEQRLLELKRFIEPSYATAHASAPAVRNPP